MIYSHLATPARQAALARLLDAPSSPSGTPRPPADLAPAASVQRRRRDARLGPHIALGNRLRSVRERLGLRHRDLAGTLGVAVQTLDRTGRRTR